MLKKSKPKQNTRQRQGKPMVSNAFPNSKYTQGFAPLKTIDNEKNKKREMVKL